MFNGMTFMEILRYLGFAILNLFVVDLFIIAAIVLFIAIVVIFKPGTKNKDDKPAENPYDNIIDFIDKDKKEGE